MKLIDKDKLDSFKYRSASERMDLPVDYMVGWNDAVDGIMCNAPTVEAIIADDNFGFAAYIIENNKYGIRVEESWNKDLDDEEMMAVMTGLIQDILADERLTRLWNDATDLAKFMMGVGDNIARVS